MTDTNRAPDAKQPGGRATRGPQIEQRGEVAPQGTVPPYPDRKERDDRAERPRPPLAGDENLSGAAGSSDPVGPQKEPASSLGANRGASPADEQPAEHFRGQTQDYEGSSWTAHTPGVQRGEERALGKSDEQLRKERTEPGINPNPPLDPETMQDTGPADQGS